MRRFEKSTTEGVVTPKKAGKAEGAADPEKWDPVLGKDHAQANG